MDQNIEIISIGDRVFPGEYSLHSSFRNVVNLSDGESLVSLVTRKVGSGPVNIVADGLDPGLIETLRINRETIFINGDPYLFDRLLLFHSHMGTGPVDKEHLVNNLLIFETSLLDLSPPKSLVFLLDREREAEFRPGFEWNLKERIKTGVDALFGREGISLAGIRKLKGIGLGLTPSGDDFIAGHLAALNLLERLDRIDRSNLKSEIVSASRSDNLLSNSFISLAGGGYLFEGFKGLLAALTRGTGSEIRTATEKLISLGASSGSDMAVGFLMTMKNFLALN